MQTKHIGGKADSDLAISIIGERAVFVGIVEQFELSLELLRAKLSGISLDGISDYGRSTSKNIASNNSIARALLSSETECKWVERLNSNDLRLYAYAKEELLPAYEREWGLSRSHTETRQESRSGDRFVGKRRLIESTGVRHLFYKPALGVYRCVKRAGVREAEVVSSVDKARACAAFAVRTEEERRDAGVPRRNLD